MVNLPQKKKNKQPISTRNGFTLVETLVTTAIFVIVTTGIYSAFANILKVMNMIRVKEIMTSIANEQFEIVRNLPYNQVGIVGGIPSGVIVQDQTISRDSKNFAVTTYIRNYDDPFDGTFDGTPKDTSPADMKTIEVTIDCTSCGEDVSPVVFTTRVAPKNLETMSTDGALVIKVFDASGQPVPEANINIVNNSVNPHINTDDQTDVNGILTIVDAPPSVGGYQITATKDGYSTERTYPTGGSGNPHPTKPNVTVVVQQISQISFTIDKVSTINISSVNNQCVATPNFTFNMVGNKLIGTNPNTYKYSNSLSTNSSGIDYLPNIEWDTYNITGTDSTDDIIGTNPLLSLGVNPNVSQNMQIITSPKNGNRLMVVVRDQSTGLPISDATVTLSNNSGYSKSYVTDQGYLIQTDWSGGSGQATIGNYNMYLSQDSNIDVTTSPGNLSLVKIFSNYAPSGYLTSSTFDTGASSNFRQINWNPQTEPSQTGPSSVRFQIATNNDNATWNFVGPDGTASTYFTLSDQNINSINNGNRYIRYRLYLSTANTLYTPTISDVSITYTSSCIPPGQVSFSSLSTGNYTVSVTKSGYQNTSKSVSVPSGWSKQEITISP